MYIIYRNNKFAGYADDKEMLKKFISTRKDSKYTYKKIKKSKIPDEILSSNSFNDYAIDYYVGYRLVTELPLFIYEFEDLYSDLGNDLLALSESLYSISELIKYLKLDKIDKQKIKYSLEHINGVIDCCTFTHEPVFDEVIDLVKYVNQKRKDDKHGFSKIEHKSIIY